MAHMLIALLMIGATLDPLATDMDRSETLRQQYQEECRLELGIASQDIDTLGPSVTYNLRRCISKKFNAYEFEQKLQRQQSRRTNRSAQLQSQAGILQERLSRRLVERQQQKLWAHTRSSMREDSLGIREMIQSEQARLRRNVHTRESTYQLQITQRRRAIIQIRQTCSSSIGEEHQTCIQTHTEYLDSQDQ